MPVRPHESLAFLRRLDALLSSGHTGNALDAASRLLRESFPQYSWVGLYRVESETLVLDGWAGDRPTEHTRIPIAQGLCGRAVREGQAVRVGDVRASSEYLACFVDTRSEIVVPVRRNGRIVGELDIDGLRLNAFDESDERFLAEVGGRLASRFDANRAPRSA